jgi:hypothetical protein
MYLFSIQINSKNEQKIPYVKALLRRAWAKRASRHSYVAAAIRCHGDTYISTCLRLVEYFQTDISIKMLGIHSFGLYTSFYNCSIKFDIILEFC